MSTSPTPILDAMSVEFGVPQCALDFAKDALALLPSGPLGAVRNNILGGKQAAEGKFNDLMMENALDLGIVQYDTDSGKFIWVSDSSEKGVDNNMLGALNDLGGIGTALGIAAAAFEEGTKVVDNLKDIKGCLDKFSSFESLSKGVSHLGHELFGFSDGVHDYSASAATKANSQLYDEQKDTLEFIVNFVNKCDKQLAKIRVITQCRLANPEECPEPCLVGNEIFTQEMWDTAVNSNVISSGDPAYISYIGQEVQNILSGTTLCMVDDTLGASDTWRNIINISGTLPPQANKGQYLMSKTGLYYDSYGGGLEYEGCISNIVSAVYYNEDGDPLPGRGVPPLMLK